ncbi:MAG: hypothetical protein ED557_00980 [Balneola sp.]|nr:MAG: hypothetical protein ED557_00980 [Balneola sp.]
MLKSFYEYTGFFGSLTLSLVFFLFFIFWIGGIAGITLPVDGGKAKYNKWQVVAAILIPIYPVFWFISDIIAQHRFMKKN